MNLGAFFKKHRTFIFLIIMMAVQLTYITYVFGWQREGHHSDENWSYGFANAYYQRQLYCDNSGNPTNFDQWTDSQVFRDYIEVGKDQRFSYDSVYFNMSEDYSPPLHSMLLHTICSFFPETFSWWYAYIINIVAFLITMISLYCFSVELIHSENISLFICFLYGTLTGSLNTFIYLRTYALLTAFAVLYALLICKMYNHGFQKPGRYLAGLFALNIAGGLCHYYFLAFVFCFTAFVLLYLLFTKRIKSALLYTAAMALSAGVYLLIWPQAWGIIGANSEMYAAHMTLAWEIKACFQFLMGEATGLLIQYPNAYTIAVFNVCLIFAVIIIAGLSFLFRNETWFRSLIKKVFHGFKSFFHKLPERFRRFNKFYLLLTATCLCTMIIIAKVSNVIWMGVYFDRYLFFLMPLVTVITVSIAAKLISKLFRTARKPFRAALVLSMTLSSIIINQFYFPCHYLFERNNDKASVEEITKDADVIVATSDEWHIVCYSTLLRDSKQFYMFNIKNCMESLDSINKLEDSPETPVYLIVQKNRLRAKDWVKDESAPEGMVPITDALTFEYNIDEIVNEISSADFATMSEYITTETGFMGDYDIYRLR